MKKILIICALLAALVLLSGCQSATIALKQIGDDIEATYIKEAKPGSGDGIDWSFVPVLRERATAMFLEGVPEAEVTDSSVAVKSSDMSRVVVTLTYKRNGITGKYGFDYEKNADGEFELVRYGDGVDSGDL